MVAVVPKPGAVFVANSTATQEHQLQRDFNAVLKHVFPPNTLTRKINERVAQQRALQKLNRKGRRRLQAQWKKAAKGRAK